MPTKNLYTQINTSLDGHNSNYDDRNAEVWDQNPLIQSQKKFFPARTKTQEKWMVSRDYYQRSPDVLSGAKTAMNSNRRKPQQ